MASELERGTRLKGENRGYFVRSWLKQFGLNWIVIYDEKETAFQQEDKNNKIAFLAVQFLQKYNDVKHLKEDKYRLLKKDALI